MEGRSEGSRGRERIVESGSLSSRILSFISGEVYFMAMYFSTMNSCRLSSCLIASATVEYSDRKPGGREGGGRREGGREGGREEEEEREGGSLTERHTSVEVVREMCLIDGVAVGVALLLQFRDPLRLQSVQCEGANL